MIEPIQTFLSQLGPTDCCQHGGLRAVRLALHPPPTPALAVSSLGAAVQAGVATLSEVGTGDVGRLLVRNRGGALLFGLAGELVLGGRQDRVLNSSVLIAPGAETAVHVSCVEPHRWCQVGGVQTFQPAQATASTTVRSAVHQTMVLNLHQTGLHSTDQERVWERVSTTLRRTGACSPGGTGTLAAGMHQHGSRLDAYARACTPTATQVGLALFTPGAQGAGLHGFAGIDCFGSPDLLRHYAARLVRGAALEARDALDPALSAAVSPGEVVRQLLAALALAQPVVSRPAAGDAPGASEHHYVLDGLVASVICHEGRPIHLSITPTDDPGRPGPRAPMPVGDPLHRPALGRGAAFQTQYFTGPRSSAGQARVVLGGAAAHLPENLRMMSVGSTTQCPASPACQIRISCPGAEARILRLSVGTYLIGRLDSCDIQLQDQTISRRHAQLDVTEGGLSIRDLGSSNGTMLNREPVLFASINAGDVVELGNHVTLHLLDINGQS